MIRKLVVWWIVLLLSAPLARPDEPPKKEDLWAAAKKGLATEVESLLTAGIAVDSTTEYGVTALQFAAEKGHVEVVRLLLKHQADVNHKDSFYGFTALGWAAGKQRWNVIVPLLEAGADGAEEVLPAAAAAGKVDVVRAALSKGTIKPAVLNRALATAAADQTEIIELLTAAGAKRPEPVEPGRYNVPQEAFVGVYRNENGVELGVALTAGKLHLTLDDRPIAEMVRAGELLFTAADNVETTYEFESDGEKVVRFLSTRNKSKTTFERRLNPDSAPPAAAIDEEDSSVVAPRNWPAFRGRNADGVADGQKPPTAWNVEGGHNLRWKTPIPGLGLSCPIVWDQRVYITSAVRDEGKSDLRIGLYGDVDSADDLTDHSWRTWCLDKDSGKVLWERIAHRGVPRTKRHTKASHANCTPATDGAHLVVNFGSEGLYCYDPDGRLLWHRDLGTLESGWFFDADYQWGFASSPVIFRETVIVQCDVGRGSYIAAYRLDDGGEVWRTPREEIPSWGSPTVVEGPDRVELITNATRFARGYDPATGVELWRLARHSEITVPTPFFAEGLIFVASGYSQPRPIYAVKPGASGDISLKEVETSNEFIAWSNPKIGPYLPTPIAYQGRLYVLSNNGIVTCVDASTGASVYSKRLPGRGAYTASPVAADGKLYFTNEQGEVNVIRAGDEFEPLAQNPLGETCLSTPAISDGRIFFRTEGHVVAVGRLNNEKKPPATDETNDKSSCSRATYMK